jgi:hypothetical protein
MGPVAGRDDGKVVPQGFIVTPGGDVYYCYNEGGFSGCFKIGHHPITLQ